MWFFSKKLVRFFSSPEFVRFFVVGASAFVLDFTILNTLIYVFKFNPFVGFISVANLISVLAAILYGFLMQRFWAFKSKDQSVIKQGSKFLGVSLFSLCINSVLYGAFIVMGVIPPLTKIIVTLLQMAWSFLLYKYFVFKIKTPIIT